MPADGDSEHAEPRAQSRATNSIAATLPPWLVTRTSLRSPARARLSPSSVQAAIAVAADKRQRAGIGRCSAETPMRCTGRNVTGRSAGKNLAHARQIGLGDEGIDAERQMRPVLLHRGERQDGDPARGASPAPAISCQVMSIQSRLGSVIGLSRQAVAESRGQRFPDHAILALPAERSNLHAVALERFCVACLRLRHRRGRFRRPVGRASARQGHLRHQLGGRSRARRLLPGAGRRHLSQIRPRRDHRAGRAERQQPHPAAGRQDRFLSERQHAAGLRRGRAERPDRRGRRVVSEGPAGPDRASRPGHREIRRSEEPDAVRLAGGNGDLLSVAQGGFRLQGQAGQALHLQSAAVPRRQEERDAGLRHVGAVRHREGRPSSRRRFSCSPTRAFPPIRR